MNNEKIIEKIATMEQRITTKVNINLFDRALIVADLLDMNKSEAFDLLATERAKILNIKLNTKNNYSTSYICKYCKTKHTNMFKTKSYFCMNCHKLNFAHNLDVKE